MSTLWQRRALEAAVVTGGAVVSLWLLGQFIDNPLIKSLTPSIYTVILGATTIGAALSALFLLIRNKPYLWVSTAALLLLPATTIGALLSTGEMHSPYVALWIISAAFASILGLRTLLPVIALVIGAAVYMVLSGRLQNYDWLVFGFTFILPLFVSYILWTPQRRAQQQQHLSESALAQELSQESNKSGIIVNAIADGVIVIDSKGTIQLINPAALAIVGWGKEDATKLDYRSVLKITDSKDTVVDEDRDPIQQCLKTHQPILTDSFGLRTVSGKKLLASIMASPLGDTGQGAVIVFRDITAKHAEEREQAEFISTASHEMRTPVAAIEGYLGLALNPQTAVIDEKARAYLQKAHESAQHLGRLFQDLLDISRIEDGRLNTSEKVIDAVEISKSIVNDFSTAIQQKGLTLSFSPDATSKNEVAPLFYIRVDIDQFREVLGNLVENAVKYTREGTVTVAIKGTDERVLISVTDSGIGIPAEDIPHLFQKFYRVDNSDTREIGGTGLGLYLSRRLIESANGQLSVDSEYGKGSTFTIDLPRVPAEEARNALEQQLSTEATPQDAQTQSSTQLTKE